MWSGVCARVVRDAGVTVGLGYSGEGLVMLSPKKHCGDGLVL